MAHKHGGLHHSGHSPNPHKEGSLHKIATHGHGGAILHAGHHGSIHHHGKGRGSKLMVTASNAKALGGK